MVSITHIYNSQYYFIFLFDYNKSSICMPIYLFIIINNCKYIPEIVGL